MKLSQIKKILNNSETIAFQLPDGNLVPSHFHVTEVGKVTKDFIDCGGKVRHESVANFQLWEANDYDHRLHPEKLVHIIELSEKVLNLADLDIEIEYQSNTIGRYDLEHNGKNFELKAKKTACLAQDACGIPIAQTKIAVAASNSCSPGGGCC